ncbi:MAG: hypothetical protein ACREMC_07420, partial [Gemmatimonadales bacterium]
RSWDLTRTFKLKILGIACVAFLIFSMPMGAVGALGGYFMIHAPLIGQAIEVLAAALPVVMTPLLSCVFTLMYYDLRVRREAFDLEILSLQLGIS